MKTKILFTAMTLIFALQLSISAQNSDRFVKVGDTTINLKNVDLEKGMNIKGKQFVKKTGDDRTMNYETSFKVFSSSKRDFYAIVFDTVKWFEGSSYGEYQAVLNYFNGNNEMLFKKTYTGLYLSAFVYYISSGGEILVVSVTGEDRESLYVLKSSGDTIKAYDGERNIHIGPLHKHSFIRDNYMYKGPNNYDFLDEHGNIKKIDFPDGFLAGIKFSPRENYYIVSLDDQQLLYDMNHKLIWKEPISKGFIYFLKDEEYYLINNPTTNALEIKGLFTHKTDRVIDNVQYHNDTIPIFRSYLVDGDFYVVGKKDSLYVYNFYNHKGELVQVETVSNCKSITQYKVKKKADRFFINYRKFNN